MMGERASNKGKKVSKMANNNNKTANQEEKGETNGGEHHSPAAAIAATASVYDALDVDLDPHMEQPSTVVREGDFVILVFGDGRQVFAECLKKQRGKSTSLKISKRSYPTGNLVGLPYGTVLELGNSSLKPLPQGEEIIPFHPSIVGETAASISTTQNSSSNDSKVKDNNTNGSFPTTAPKEGGGVKLVQANDNRHLVDNNKSQSLRQEELMNMRRSGKEGAEIVDKLIRNSTTFDKKTDFSKAKYVLRKQIKYQPRCRLVRCTAATVCEALFLKDPRRLMNMRDDTLGQILSYSNISAGCQTLVFETCMGVVTGAVAERMGGYGRVISIYSGQQPSYQEMINRFNLSFAENFSIKWVHSGDVFGDNNIHDNDNPSDKNGNEQETVVDPEVVEREKLIWPCPLQPHTRKYLTTMTTDLEVNEFLAKRCARFARKLTRHSTLESNAFLAKRKCDSVIIVCRYDPTVTLLSLLPYLAPSCPFVVFCEFIEPLTSCFRELQKQSLAINLRLSDTWTREYQILPGRTHPNMSISQSGGFILTGIKLCPVTGHADIDEKIKEEVRQTIGGRRGRKSKNKASQQQPPPAKESSNKKRKAPPDGHDDANKSRKENH